MPGIDRLLSASQNLAGGAQMHVFRDAYNVNLGWVGRARAVGGKVVGKQRFHIHIMLLKGGGLGCRYNYSYTSAGFHFPGRDDQSVVSEKNWQRHTPLAQA